MTRRLALLGLALALGLTLAGPAGAYMPDPPLDPTQEAMPTACPPGMVWSPELNTCVSPEQWGEQGGPPMPGPGGMPEPPALDMPGQGAAPPPEGCPPGLVWSSAQARCVQPRPDWDCGPGYGWSHHWRRCVPQCPPGMRYNPWRNDCQPVPPGTR